VNPRWLVAPLEFKGTLTSSEATEALVAGLKEAAPEVMLDLAPLADGGAGTIEALLAGTPGERRTLTVQGPLGAPVQAGYAVIDAGRTAIIEVASASGLVRVPPEERDARRASSYGTGELMRAALDSGCTKLIIGLGGSATTDAGVGALTALGLRFLDVEGKPLPPGGAALNRLARVDATQRHPRLTEVELLAASDVTSPLLGPNGAARLFSQQKGADALAVEELEAALEYFSRGLGPEFIRVPGAGAGGGLGFGLAVLAGASIMSGYALVAQALQLQRRVAVADAVLTGEGRFDRQTGLGKGPASLARTSRELGKPVVLFAGSVAREEQLETTLFREIIDIGTREVGKAAAAQALREAAARWATVARLLKPPDSRERMTRKDGQLVGSGSM
jgi:glycerate kinase